MVQSLPGCNQKVEIPSKSLHLYPSLNLDQLEAWQRLRELESDLCGVAGMRNVLISVSFIGLHTCVCSINP
jgi:hypothetical protein